MVARWLARLDTVKGQIQSFSLMLQGFGLGYLVPYIGIIGTLLGMVYTYYWSEGGVYNQKQRDFMDLGNNYAEPQNLIGHRIGGQQLAYLGYVLQNGKVESFEEIEREMEELTEAEWAALRNGIDVEGVEEVHG